MTALDCPLLLAFLHFVVCLTDILPLFAAADELGRFPEFLVIVLRRNADATTSATATAAVVVVVVVGAAADVTVAIHASPSVVVCVYATASTASTAAAAAAAAAGVIFPSLRRAIKRTHWQKR